MSLRQLTSQAIWRIAILLITYFTTGPAYYMVLDALRDQALVNGGAGLTVFLAWAYPAFYYGFPTIIVLGIIFILLGFYGSLRRRYYATEERGYYGS